MIKSFGNKETQKLFHAQNPGNSRLPQNLQQRAINKLWILSAATNINELRSPPANHLEQLKGNRIGQHSVRINKKWRICFHWINNNAYNVEIIDYHS